MSRDNQFQVSGRALLWACFGITNDPKGLSMELQDWTQLLLGKKYTHTTVWQSLSAHWVLSECSLSASECPLSAHWVLSEYSWSESEPKRQRLRASDKIHRPKTDKDDHFLISCWSQKILKQAHHSPYPDAGSHRTPCIYYFQTSSEKIWDSGKHPHSCTIFLT